MRKPWFQQLEETRARTGFWVSAVVHPPTCGYATCFAERLERQKAGAEL
ncbi:MULTISPECIES: hypothetical protein [Nocardia]|nr:MULTISPECIES: hypothetical protein [Nocardia]